nr:uncharacterized protein LOC120976914 isoform X2 [Aegilops tauschii subsp. strangulata]
MGKRPPVVIPLRLFPFPSPKSEELRTGRRDAELQGFFNEQIACYYTTNERGRPTLLVETQCKYIFSSSTSTPMITHHYPEILFLQKYTRDDLQNLSEPLQPQEQGKRHQHVSLEGVQKCMGRFHLLKRP